MAKQLSLEQLIIYGWEKDTAVAMLSPINQLLNSLPAVECWQYFSRKILKPHHPFSLHQLLYRTIFADWDSSQGEPPVWIPDRDRIQATNIAALMQELNLASYAELHAWSIQNRAQFWDVMIKRLDISFQAKYTQIVDLSRGIESPQWLLGARLNIVDSCFQADRDDIAIIGQKQGGSLFTLSYGELELLTDRVANSLLDLDYNPGDRIKRLPNSYYRAQGRADDTMNLSGIKVSSAEIERVLNTVKGVRETAAIAVSPHQGGTSQLIIYAVVIPKVQTDKDCLRVALQTAIKQHLNPLFKIADLEIVTTLPRTASNKVMHRVLRDRYYQNMSPKNKKLEELR